MEKGEREREREREERALGRSWRNRQLASHPAAAARGGREGDGGTDKGMQALQRDQVIATERE